jgi:hypothetical protein
MLAFTTPLVLFLLLQQQLLVSADVAQVAILKSLVRSGGCMQRCFLPTCQDLGPGCVCRLLVTAPETSRTCTISECSPKGEYNAFPDVWNECLSRKDELGIGELPGE